MVVMKFRILLIVYMVILSLNTVSSFKCPSSSSSKEANPLSCRKFYICESSTPEEQECGDSDTFDVLYRQCRATELVENCNYSPTDCYIDSGSGFDYQGTTNVTASGEACLEWSQSVYSFSKYKLEKNYCRNPNPDQFSQPWCTTNNMTSPMQPCNIPKCKGSSVKFTGKGELTVTTGTGGTDNAVYDLEASYEEQILLYIRPSAANMQTRADLFKISSELDEQSYLVTLYKNVITVFAWLEKDKSAKANTMINMVDGKAHKIHITRKGYEVTLNVDNGHNHSSILPGLTDKLMLPLKVTIGKNFQGCISSFDIVTKNAAGKYRHYEPFDKLMGKNTDNQLEVTLSEEFNGDASSGCILTPRFSEIFQDVSDKKSNIVDTHVSPNNGTTAEVGIKDNKELFIILAGVIGAALVILIIVLILVCRNRNKDKGVYKLKETKQFDWEYGNLPPSSKKLMSENEHGV